MSLFNLKNKSFLITGSSKGIGKSIAFHAADHGAQVIISSRKIDACNETANEINEHCGAEVAFPIQANIAHEEELNNLVDQTNKLLGKIDVLICNAATNPFMGSMADIPSDAFDKVMNNNIKANHILTNLVTPQMIDRKDGVIIIISSVGGTIGSNLIGTYNISKAADIQMVKNIAVEYGHHNIRANTVAPGLIRTDFARGLWENPVIHEQYTKTHPMRRIGEPDEVAGAVIMLASDAGKYINGQTIIVDGGATT
ncbi:glucose 1-dehydrogenase [Gammaproteobacteria bacterium]|mgnify:FL=1|jgi:NAD(P)-dependent dehydrogenase (short-subunit alcohol dehydrogenase family)|nr:glucose 1-dehydrogenase [Gammaproteobacteria bacterium]MDA9971062.1 glucose 1-dehydrogenase [Gammaproteobacteria bacterium]MDB4072992.1 glucose 1-dehydrogenase [Gammaproteobacteria bacterium]MDB9783661.1 glucose 1-dehydrogenase [Gammaproteobacteria bacterium]MDB9815570.1 glucose 1-dehydrogenase [Gammaproteobacteria bacterium]